MSTDYEKRGETIAFKAPERIAAWLRDRSRMLDMKPSALVCKVVTEYLETPEGLRKPEFSKPEIVSDLETAKATIDAVLSKMKMAGTNGNGRARKSA